MSKRLFTIGYEGLDPERLRDALQSAGVAVLADVRAVANSRKRGFSKGALKAGWRKPGSATRICAPSARRNPAARPPAPTMPRC